MALSMSSSRTLTLLEATMFRGLWLPSTQTPAGRLRKLPPVFRRLESTIAEKSHVPRFAQPSIWKDIIPKPLRSWPGSSKPAQNTRNPAYYFIWIYLLIGSQAIRILTIKREAAEEHRLADIKLRQLREVIEKLERGEEVDVEKALGTGNEEAEAEWEAALRELESEERLWQNNRSRRRAERHKRQMEEMDADPINEEDSEELHDPRPLDRPQSAPTTPGFY